MLIDCHLNLNLSVISFFYIHFRLDTKLGLALEVYYSPPFRSQNSQNKLCGPDRKGGFYYIKFLFYFFLNFNSFKVNIILVNFILYINFFCLS